MPRLLFPRAGVDRRCLTLLRLMVRNCRRWASRRRLRDPAASFVSAAANASVASERRQTRGCRRRTRGAKAKMIFYTRDLRGGISRVCSPTAGSAVNGGHGGVAIRAAIRTHELRSAFREYQILILRVRGDVSPRSAGASPRKSTLYNIGYGRYRKFPFGYSILVLFRHFQMTFPIR